MIGMWYAEAGKYNVLPIDSRGVERFADERPQVAVARKRYVYYSGAQTVPATAVPRLVNAPHSVFVHATVPKGGAEGVLFAMGGVEGGFAFYVQGGRLTYGYNYVAAQSFRIGSDAPVPEGAHILGFAFTPTARPEIARGKGAPATVTLYVDGQPVGRGELPVTIPLTMGISAGASVGADVGSPVMTDYAPPFAFTGDISKVLLDVSGDAVEDRAQLAKAWLALAMARQ
jgi:arylsulfatase